MIIITQEKDYVINGDIVELYISDGTTIKTSLRGNQYEVYTLGVYSTTNQAREVLLDMAECIRDPDERIYQMPPDQKPEPEPSPEKWISQLSARLDEMRKSDPRNA